MRFHAPKPSVMILGAVSIQTATGIAALVQIVVCVFFIASVDSNHPVSWGGARISPLAQTMNAAFYLLGLPVIIYGMIGVLYQVTHMVKTYWYYTLAHLLLIFSYFFIIIWFGEVDDSGTSQFIAGLARSLAILIGALLLLIVAGVSYLVWSMWKLLVTFDEEVLRNMQAPFSAVVKMADELAEEEAKSRWFRGGAKLDGASRVLEGDQNAHVPLFAPAAGYNQTHIESPTTAFPMFQNAMRERVPSPNFQSVTIPDFS